MRSKLRVAIFNWRSPDDPKSGGAERVTMEHAKYWVKKGVDVTWFSGAFPGCSRREQNDGVSFLRIGPSALFFLLSPIFYWFYSGGRFDVVVDEVHGLPNFSPLWAWQSRRIAFIHEVAQEIWDEMYPFPISVFCRALEHFSLKVIYKGTPFWVDALSTAQDLFRLDHQPGKVTVIPCAIQPLAGVGKKPSTLTVAVVARLVPMKGIHHAISTFAQIAKREPSARLWIVGDGEMKYVSQLRALAKSLGIGTKIFWLGKISEQEKYNRLAKAHFLLHTSIREGFGLTVLEAGSQKTPTAAFRVPGLKDLILDEKTGVLVPQGDIDRLAKRVVALYNDKTSYSRVAQNAKKYADSFTWPKFTRMSFELIKKL